MMPFIFRSSARSKLLPADTWMAKASFFGILCQIKKDAALRLYPFLFQNLKDSLRAFFLSYCPCDHNQNAKTCQYLSCCHSRRMIQNSDFMFSCFQMKSQKRLFTFSHFTFTPSIVISNPLSNGMDVMNIPSF